MKVGNVGTPETRTGSKAQTKGQVRISIKGVADCRELSEWLRGHFQVRYMYIEIKEV
jgi:hypothetical protein